MRNLRLPLFLTLMASGCQCGDSLVTDAGAMTAPDSGTHPGDAGVVDSGAVDAGAPSCVASGSCNELTLAGPRVAVHSSAAARPALNGGSIADGTYDLTDVTVYETDAGVTQLIALQETLVFAGSIVQRIKAEIDADGGCVVRRTSHSLTVLPMQLSLVETCPNDTRTCGDGSLRSRSADVTAA